MPRFIKRRSKKAGLAPGTLVHIGDHKTERIKITLIDYNDFFSQAGLAHKRNHQWNDEI